MYSVTVLAKVLNDGTAVCTERTDERLDTRVNQLMSDELSSHGELLEANVTHKRLLSMTSHVTTQSLHRCTQHPRSMTRSDL